MSVDKPCNFFNSDMNSFRSKKSCLRGRFGFKRHFLSNSFHSSKLLLKNAKKCHVLRLNGPNKRSLKCKFVREKAKHYLTEISKVKMKCHFIFQFLADWQVQRKPFDLLSPKKYCFVTIIVTFIFTDIDKWFWGSIS